MKAHVRKVLIVKGVIMVGLIAAYAVPPSVAPIVASCANCLWLFWESKE